MITPAQIKAVIAALSTTGNDADTLGENTLDLLDTIETEVMKRGTLAEETLDQKKLEECCLKVLEKHTHMTAIRGLVIALTISNQSSGLISALNVTTAMFDTCWPDLHPKGPKSARRRDAWAKDIVHTLNVGVEQVIKHDGGLSKDCTKAGMACIKACEVADQDVTQLKKSLQGQVRANERKAKPAVAAGVGTVTTGQLDAKARADLRRDIRTIADRIEHFDADTGLAYQMRGFAAWLEFSSPPEADAGGVTQEQAMPAFVAEEHTKNAKAPNTASLAKLEDRLYMSPDWFEGQKLAYDMANALERPEVAQAVLNRVQGRLAAQPELRALKYANNKPIISNDIASWVGTSSVAIASPSPAPANEETEATPEFLPQLKALNKELAQARSPRASAIVKQKIARVIRTNGLKEQAKMMYAELADQMSAEVLQKWDAEFFAEIKKEGSRKT